MAPLSNKQKAWAQNRAISNLAEGKGQKKEMVPVATAGLSTTKIKALRTIFKQIQTGLNLDLASGIPPTISTPEALLVYRLFTVAVRDNSEFPQVYCPICRAHHHADAKVKCPVHNGPDDAELPCEVPQIHLERNSITAASKVIDKIYPNITAIAASIQTESSMDHVSQLMIRVIVKYVPKDHIQACLRDIENMLSSQFKKHGQG